MPIVIFIPLGNAVAIGQQHRTGFSGSVQSHRKFGQTIRAVQIIGDTPETLCLALRQKLPTRKVQTGQGRIGSGMNLYPGFQYKLRFRVQQGQTRRISTKQIFRQGLTISQNTQQFQEFAVQMQLGHRPRSQALKMQTGLHFGVFRVQMNIQRDLAYPIKGRLIIFAMNNRVIILSSHQRQAPFSRLLI